MFVAIQQFDETILYFIQENLKNPVMDRFMVFITTLGNAGFLWIFVAFLLLSQKRHQICGVPLICSVSLSMFLGDHMLKPLFGRIRPCNLYPEISLLISAPSSPSFPSGHTMVAFASATVIYHYYRKSGLLAFVTAALIAFSRLYLFVHYPSDILGGIILGVLVSLLVIYAVEKLYNYLPNQRKKQRPTPHY